MNYPQAAVKKTMKKALSKDSYREYAKNLTQKSGFSLIGVRANYNSNKQCPLSDKASELKRRIERDSVFVEQRVSQLR